MHGLYVQANGLGVGAREGSGELDGQSHCVCVKKKKRYWVSGEARVGEVGGESRSLYK